MISSVVHTEILLYSVIIDLVMIIYLSAQKNRHNFSSNLFKATVASVAFVAIAEASTWFAGRPGEAAQIPFQYWSNVIFFSTVALPGALGFAYLDFKIFGNETRSQRRLFAYLIPTYVSVITVLYNFSAPGFLFSISYTNEYIRGPGVYMLNLIMFGYVLLVEILFFRHKKLFTGRITQALLIFALVPFLGSVLQLLLFGTSFVLPAYTLAALLTFLLLEKEELSRDPLTGLRNRGNLENRLRFKLKANVPFSILMVDLNDFKWINDNLGHSEGDRVLQMVSSILVQSLDYEDTVCRYGGDEFFVLVENSEDIGEKVIRRIEQHLERYSRSLANYDVSLSFGYEFIKEPAKTDLKELMHQVDQKMYDDKSRRKSTSARSGSGIR